MGCGQSNQKDVVSPRSANGRVSSGSAGQRQKPQVEVKPMHKEERDTGQANGNRDNNDKVDVNKDDKVQSERMSNIKEDSGKNDEENVKVTDTKKDDHSDSRSERSLTSMSIQSDQADQQREGRDDNTSMDDEQKMAAQESAAMISSVMMKAEENVIQLKNEDEDSAIMDDTISLEDNEKKGGSAKMAAGIALSREKSQESEKLHVSDMSHESSSREVTPVNMVSESDDGLLVLELADKESEKKEVEEEEKKSPDDNDNVYDDGVVLPPIPQRERPASGECPYGSSKSKWPIRNYCKVLDFYVNAGHGGCAGLLFCSCSYGGKGEETTAEIFLYSSGFDCNHYGMSSIVRDHSGHFGCSNVWLTDEEGLLIGNLLFGNNHLMMLTNDSKNGRLGNGMFAQSSGDGPTQLHINVNGKNGGGNILVLCSGVEDGNKVNAAYMVRCGFKDNFIKKKLIHGDDKWNFETSNDGVLQVQGPKDSQYSVYINRENMKVGEAKKSNVLMTQTWNGENQVTLSENVPEHGIFWVLCSNSMGTEKRTCAALYGVWVESGSKLGTKLVSSHNGEGYTTSDLWKFEIAGTSIVTTGPKGPCRYAVMSNQPYDDQQYIFQDICLATGEPQPIRGIVETDLEKVQGILEKPSDLCIMVDCKPVRVLKSQHLKQVQNGWAFKIVWKPEEICVGYHIVRVYAVRKHVTTNVEQRVELTGSPKQLTLQKDKVVYALNAAGPAYTSVEGITYGSEHKEYASFTYDFNCGSQCLAYGVNKHHASIPALMCRTNDGFLYVTNRNANPEPVDEQKIIYTVKNIPDGEYILRMHHGEKPQRGSKAHFNGQNILPMIEDSYKKHKVPQESLPVTAYLSEVPVQVVNNKCVLEFKPYISAFALLERSYKDPVLSPEEQQSENKERQQLMDKTEPVTQSLSRKEMKIVGWSQNLLKNPSAESGDMSNWNVSGNWAIHEGGYGAEKAFKTSHMECEKYQEVDLLEYFSAEYLDTAPDIEISEWYREGVCGGGYYEMEASLLDTDGNVVAKYNKERTGRIYNDSKWSQCSKVFSNYGKGVRLASLSSMGKDDKYWAGHFGTIISSSVIRVKRESLPAADDSYRDLDLDEESNAAWTSKTDKLVSKVLSDNKEVLQELLTEDVVPSFDQTFEKQMEVKTTSRKSQRRLKKREIRVFVSSTFKDFSKEREEVIKKTFREINRLCAERGVFFTYVDLRWGISTEQSNDGQTIAICLQEIDRCRPYFLCMMGDRFGWSQQDNKVDELLNKSYDVAMEKYPHLSWIDDYRFNTSVTQLEILHGVLNNAEVNKKRSFFYLRDTVKPEDVEPDQIKVYLSESDWHKERQDTLKSAVRSSGGLNIRKFNSPSEVANLIRDDLTWCIDEDFPKGTELTPLEREREAHQAFADVRCQVYIGRENYFTQIDEYLEQEITQPMVILGESGSGKSALVANWEKRTREKYPDAFVFVHFIGSSAESADYLKLLRRLYEEMKEFFSLSLSVPSSDVTLVHELSKWFQLIASRGKSIIILDALNQLDDGSNDEGPEHDLKWIPPTIPKNIFLLMSTLPGKAMDAVKAAGWPTMKVSPLEPSQKMEILTGYLEGIYSKTLSQEQKDMIVDAPQTNNPLYLRSLLDEVRIYGSFRQLTNKIKEYLTADSPGDLFAKILSRLEGDFEGEDEKRQNMVMETTTAIWCSHRGMSEGELIELLKVPSALWSPFYMSMVENLVNRNGILNFFHDHLRQAVEKKYLSTPEAKKSGYLHLANFFAEKEMDDRVVDELPFLLARAGELERLKETISRFDVFTRLLKTEDGKFELIKSWQLLGDYSLVQTAYLKKLSEIPESEKNSNSYTQLLDQLGRFFVDLGLYEAAREVFEKLVADIEKRYSISHGTIVYNHFNQSWIYRSKHVDVINALHQLGLICEKQNELNAGEKYYRDSINRQNKVTTPSQKLQLCQGLLGLASIMNLKDNMPESKKLLVRALELATDVLGKQHHFVAAILNKLGKLSYSQGRLDEALGYFLQDLKLTRSEVGVSHPRIGRLLNDLALVYDDKLDKLAGELYESGLALLYETYGSAHVDVAKVRYNLGTFYFATNHFAQAKFQFEQALSIFQAFLGDDHPDTKATQTALKELP